MKTETIIAIIFLLLAFAAGVVFGLTIPDEATAGAIGMLFIAGLLLALLSQLFESCRSMGCGIGLIAGLGFLAGLLVTSMARTAAEMLLQLAS